ncbi:MAG: hypothetical protein AAGG07_02810 [Planctomycetota bacterium]
MSSEPIARMPYFEQYLRSVLRPKVLEILESHQGNWHELIMDVIAEAIANDPESGFQGDRAEVSSLLRDQLGLRMKVSVKAAFEAGDGHEEAPAETGGNANASGAAQDAPADSDAEQVEVRRRPSMSPLAKAVSSGKRR